MSATALSESRKRKDKLNPYQLIAKDLPRSVANKVCG